MMEEYRITFSLVEAYFYLTYISKWWILDIIKRLRTIVVCRIRTNTVFENHSTTAVQSKTQTIRSESPINLSQT